MYKFKILARVYKTDYLSIYLVTKIIDKLVRMIQRYYFLVSILSVNTTDRCTITRADSCVIFYMYNTLHIQYIFIRNYTVSNKKVLSLIKSLSLLV